MIYPSIITKEFIKVDTNQCQVYDPRSRSQNSCTYNQRNSHPWMEASVIKWSDNQSLQTDSLKLGSADLRSREPLAASDVSNISTS